jgi:hypothetical protein
VKRNAPWATATYAAVLFITTVVQHVVLAATRHRLLLGSSTDVAHLARDPALVLLASAFWLPDVTSLLLAPLVLAVLAVGERRFGTARVLVAFAIGHVLSSVLTEGFVWVAVHAGWMSSAHEHRLDVGPSYGTCAVLGLFVAALSTRHRTTAYVGWLLLFGIPLVFDSELTTVGHLLAAVIGLSLWQVPWFRQSRVVTARLPAPCPRGCSSASRC